MNNKKTSAIALNENITKTIHDNKDTVHIMPVINEVYDSYVSNQVEAFNHDHGTKLTKKEYHAKLRSDINSPNEVIRERANKTMGQLITDLAYLVLKQTISNDFNTNIEAGFNSKFVGEDLNEGNSFQYQKTLTTGHSVYNVDEYYPNKLSQPKIAQFTANMYDPATGNLDKNSFQFKKSFSITRAQWMPYYISGKLDQLIAEVAGQMKNTFDIYLYDKNMRVLTDPATISKKISGVATNMYDCFSTEILPEIHKLRLNTDQYNFDATCPVISSSSPSDIIILMNSITATKFRTGIQAQLPSANLTNIEQSGENIFEAGFKYNIPGNDGENTIITVSNVEYIDENTVIVFDKNSIKNHMQVQYLGSQEYATNMITEKTNHIWGHVCALPWGKGFVYTNANLQKMPTNTLETN